MIGILVPPSLPPNRFVEFVRRADALGFDQAWVVEDCFWHGGVAQAATALALTERITLAIGILPAAVRNVAMAALDLAFLANLHPDRLLVGVGHGMPDWMRQIGAWPRSPLDLLGEYTTALRALLRGETVDTTGRYVRLTGVRLEYPPAVVPPVLLGVRGPKSLALSGRCADGTILAEPSTPEYLRAARASIAATGPHRIAAYNLAAVADDPAAARELVRPGLSVVADPGWAAHVDPLPFAAELRQTRPVALPDAWVDQLAVVGTPEDVRRRVAELAAAGADDVVLTPVGPDPIAAMQALGVALAG